MIKAVYLAGPISGLSFDEAVLGWREKIKDLLSDDIKVLSPMRGKDHLKGIEKFNQVLQSKHPMSTGKGILCRDTFDVMNCGVILANFLGAREKSIGTIFEIALAWQLRKPIVLVIEESGNPHAHDFILEAANYIVRDLDDAAEVVNKICMGY